MKNFIVKDFLLDEELDGIVGGDVLPNGNQADPNIHALENADTNAAFNRGGGGGGGGSSGAIVCASCTVPVPI